MQRDSEIDVDGIDFDAAAPERPTIGGKLMTSDHMKSHAQYMDNVLTKLGSDTHLGAKDVVIKDLDCPDWLKLSLQVLDIDHSGAVNREELTHYLKKIADARKRKENNSKELDYRDMADCVQDALKVWDADGSGTVSVSELTSAAKAQKKMEAENRYLKYGVVLLIGLIMVLAVLNFVCSLAAVEAGKDMRPNEESSSSSHRQLLRGDVTKHGFSTEMMEFFDSQSGPNNSANNRRLRAFAEKSGRRVLHANDGGGQAPAGALQTDGDTKGNVGTAPLADTHLGMGTLDLLKGMTTADYARTEGITLPCAVGGKFTCKPSSMTESQENGAIHKSFSCPSEGGEIAEKSFTVIIPPDEDAGQGPVSRALRALHEDGTLNEMYDPTKPEFYCFLRRTRLLTRDGRLTHHRKPSFERSMAMFKEEKHLRRRRLVEENRRQLNEDEEAAEEGNAFSGNAFNDEEFRILEEDWMHEKLTYTHIKQTIGDNEYPLYAEDIADNGLSANGLMAPGCDSVEPATRQLLNQKVKVVHARKQRRLQGRRLDDQCSNGVLPHSELETMSNQQITDEIVHCFAEDYQEHEDMVLVMPNTGAEPVEARVTIGLGFEKNAQIMPPEIPDICSFAPDPEECTFYDGADLKRACDAHPECPFRNNGGMPIPTDARRLSGHGGAHDGHDGHDDHGHHSPGSMMVPGQDPMNTDADFQRIIDAVEYPRGTGADAEDIMNHFEPAGGTSESFEEKRDRLSTQATDVQRMTVGAALNEENMHRRLDEAELLNGNYRRRVRVVRSLEVEDPSTKQKSTKQVRRLESAESHRRKLAGHTAGVADFDVVSVAREMDAKMDTKNPCRKMGIEHAMVEKDLADRANYLHESAGKIVSSCDKDEFQNEISAEEMECIDKQVTRNLGDAMDDEKDKAKPENSVGCFAAKKPLPESGLKCSDGKEVKTYLRCNKRDAVGCKKKCKSMDQDGDGILTTEECASNGEKKAWDLALDKCAGGDEKKKKKCEKQGVRLQDCMSALLDKGELANRKAAKIICHMRDTLDGRIALRKKRGISQAEMNTDFKLILAKIDGGSAPDGSARSRKIRQLLNQYTYTRDEKTGKLVKSYDHGLHRRTDNSIQGGFKKRRALFGRSDRRQLSSRLPFAKSKKSMPTTSHAERRILAGQEIPALENEEDYSVVGSDLFHEVIFGELVHRPRMRRMEAKIVSQEIAMRNGMKATLGTSEKYEKWLLERQLKHTEKLRRRRILLSFDREVDDPDEVHRKLQRVSRRLHEISYHAHEKNGENLEKAGRKLLADDSNEDRQLRHLLQDSRHLLSNHMETYAALFNIKATSKDMKELMYLTHAAKRNLEKVKWEQFGEDVGKCLEYGCATSYNPDSLNQEAPTNLGEYLLNKFKKKNGKVVWDLTKQQKAVLMTLLKEGAKKKKKVWRVSDLEKITKLADDVGMYIASRLPSDTVNEENNETGNTVETAHVFDAIRTQGENLCGATRTGRRLLAKHRQLLEIAERRRMTVFEKFERRVLSAEEHREHQRQLEQVDEMVRKLSGHQGFPDLIKACNTPVITADEMSEAFPEKPEKTTRMQPIIQREVDGVLTAQGQNQNRVLRSLEHILSPNEKRELAAIDQEHRAMTTVAAEAGEPDLDDGFVATHCAFVAAEDPAVHSNLVGSGFNSQALQEGDPEWCKHEMEAMVQVQTNMPECFGAEMDDNMMPTTTYQYEMGTPVLSEDGHVNDWATCSGFPQVAPGQVDRDDVADLLTKLNVPLDGPVGNVSPGTPQVHFDSPPDARRALFESLKTEASLASDPVRKVSHIHNSRKVHKRVLRKLSKDEKQNLHKSEREFYSEKTPKFERHSRKLSTHKDIEMDMFQHKRVSVSYKQALDMKAEDTLKQKRRQMLESGEISYGVLHLSSVNLDAHGRRLSAAIDPAYCSDPNLTRAEKLVCQTGQVHESTASMASPSTCMCKDGAIHPKPDTVAKPAPEAEEVTFVTWLADVLSNWEKLPRSCQSLPIAERVLPMNGGSHNINLDSLNTFVNNLKADKLGVGCIEECGCVYVGTDPSDGSEFVANTCDPRRPCQCLVNKQNCFDEVGRMWEARGGFRNGGEPEIRDERSRAERKLMALFRSDKSAAPRSSKRRDRKLALMKSVRKHRRDSMNYRRLTSHDNHRILHELRMRKEKRSFMAKRHLSTEHFKKLEKAEEMFHRGFGRAHLSIRKLTGKRGDRFRKLQTLDKADRIRRRMLEEKRRKMLENPKLRANFAAFLNHRRLAGTAPDPDNYNFASALGTEMYYPDMGHNNNDQKSYAENSQPDTVAPAVYDANNVPATVSPALYERGYGEAGTGKWDPANPVYHTDAPGTGSNKHGMQGKDIQRVPDRLEPVFPKSPAAMEQADPDAFSDLNPMDIEKFIHFGFFEGNDWFDLTAVDVQPLRLNDTMAAVNAGSATMIGAHTPTYELCYEAWDLRGMFTGNSDANTGLPNKSVSGCLPVRPYKVEEFGYHPLLLEDFHQGPLYCPERDDRDFKDALNMYEERGYNPAMYGANQESTCVDGLPALRETVGSHIADQEQERSYGRDAGTTGDREARDTFGEEGTSTRRELPNRAREIHEACKNEGPMDMEKKYEQLYEFAEGFRCPSDSRDCDPKWFACDVSSMEDPRDPVHDYYKEDDCYRRGSDFQLGDFMIEQIEVFREKNDPRLLTNRHLMEKLTSIEAESRDVVSRDSAQHGINQAVENMIGGPDFHEVFTELIPNGHCAGSMSREAVQAGSLFEKISQDFSSDAASKSITIGNVDKFSEDVCIGKNEVSDGTMPFCTELNMIKTTLADLTIREKNHEKDAWEQVRGDHNDAKLTEEDFNRARSASEGGSPLSAIGDSIARNDHHCIDLVADKRGCQDRECMDGAYQELTRGEPVGSARDMEGARTETQQIRVNAMGAGDSLSHSDEKQMDERMLATQERNQASKQLGRDRTDARNVADKLMGDMVRSRRQRVLREARRLLEEDRRRELADLETAQMTDPSAARRLAILETGPRRLSEDHMRRAEEVEHKRVDEHTGMTNKQRAATFKELREQRRRRLSRKLSKMSLSSTSKRRTLSATHIDMFAGSMDPPACEPGMHHDGTQCVAEAPGMGHLSAEALSAEPISTTKVAELMSVCDNAIPTLDRQLKTLEEANKKTQEGDTPAPLMESQRHAADHARVLLEEFTVEFQPLLDAVASKVQRADLLAKNETAATVRENEGNPKRQGADGALPVGAHGAPMKDATAEVTMTLNATEAEMFEAAFYNFVEMTEDLFPEAPKSTVIEPTGFFEMCMDDHSDMPDHGDMMVYDPMDMEPPSAMADFVGHQEADEGHDDRSVAMEMCQTEFHEMCPDFGGDCYIADAAQNTAPEAGEIAPGMEVHNVMIETPCDGTSVAPGTSSEGMAAYGFGRKLSFEKNHKKFSRHHDRKLAQKALAHKKARKTLFKNSKRTQKQKKILEKRRALKERRLANIQSGEFVAQRFGHKRQNRVVLLDTHITPQMRDKRRLDSSMYMLPAGDLPASCGSFQMNAGDSAILMHGCTTGICASPEQTAETFMDTCSGVHHEHTMQMQEASMKVTAAADAAYDAEHQPDSMMDFAMDYYDPEFDAYDYSMLYGPDTFPRRSLKSTMKSLKGTKRGTKARIAELKKDRLENLKKKGNMRRGLKSRSHFRDNLVRESHKKIQAKLAVHSLKQLIKKSSKQRKLKQTGAKKSIDSKKVVEKIDLFQGVKPNPVLLHVSRVIKAANKRRRLQYDFPELEHYSSLPPENAAFDVINTEVPTHDEFMMETGLALEGVDGMEGMYASTETANSLGDTLATEAYIAGEFYNDNAAEKFVEASKDIWSTTTLTPPVTTTMPPMPMVTMGDAAALMPKEAPKTQDSAGTDVPTGWTEPPPATIAPIPESTLYGTEFYTECVTDETTTPAVDSCCEVYTGEDMGKINEAADACFDKLGHLPHLYEGLYDPKPDAEKQQEEERARKVAAEVPTAARIDEATLNCVENSMLGDGTPSGQPPKMDNDEDDMDCENLPESSLMEQRCDDYCEPWMASCPTCWTEQVDLVAECETEKLVKKKAKKLENILLKLAKKKGKIAVSAGIRVEVKRALRANKEVPSIIRELARFPQEWDQESERRALQSFDAMETLESYMPNVTDVVDADPVQVANDPTFCSLNNGEEDHNDEMFGGGEQEHEIDGIYALAMPGGMAVGFQPEMEKLLLDYADSVHEKVHEVYNKLRNPDGVYLAKMLRYAANFKQIDNIVKTLREIGQARGLTWEDECNDFHGAESLGCNDLQWMSRGYNQTAQFDWSSGKQWWEFDAMQPFVNSKNRPHNVCIRNARKIGRGLPDQVRMALADALRRLGDWNPASGRPRWLQRLEDAGGWKETSPGVWGPTPYNKENIVMTNAEKKTMCSDLYNDENGLGYQDFRKRYWHWDPETYTSTEIDEPNDNYRSIKDDLLSCDNFPEGCDQSARLFKNACVKTLEAMEDALVPTDKMVEHCSQWGWCSTNYDGSDDFVSKYYPSGYDKNGEVQPPYRSAWDSDNMRRALIGMFDVTTIPQWMTDYPPYNAGDNYEPLPPGTKLARCMIQNVKENLVERMLKEMLASVEKKKKAPETMCAELVGEKYASKNFTNSTSFNKMMEHHDMPELVNATAMDKALAMASSIDEDCKQYCVDYELWKSSSAAMAGSFPSFNASTFLEHGGDSTDLMPPAAVEGCDPDLSCELVSDFVPLAEQNFMAVSSASRRVRRQRRARRQLIEKRRRLEREDREERRRLAGGETNAATSCVTLNGDKYCKEGSSEKNNDNWQLSEQQRRLQEHQDHYEELGIDVILPASRKAGSGHTKLKVKRGLFKQLRMKNKHRKLRR